MDDDVIDEFIVEDDFNPYPVDAYVDSSKGTVILILKQDGKVTAYQIPDNDRNREAVIRVLSSGGKERYEKDKEPWCDVEEI